MKEKDKLKPLPNLVVPKRVMESQWEALIDVGNRIPIIVRRLLDKAETAESINEIVRAMEALASYRKDFAEAFAKFGTVNPMELNLTEVILEGRRRHGDKFIELVSSISSRPDWEAIRDELRTTPAELVEPPENAPS